jgi:hypothetical protein
MIDETLKVSCKDFDAGGGELFMVVVDDMRVKR